MTAGLEEQAFKAGMQSSQTSSSIWMPLLFQILSDAA